MSYAENLNVRRNWEECPKEARDARWASFYASMNPAGDIVISGYTHKKLGGTDGYLLLFDRERQVIGLRPARLEKDMNAYPARPRGEARRAADSRVPAMQGVRDRAGAHRQVPQVPDGQSGRADTGPERGEDDREEKRALVIRWGGFGVPLFPLRGSSPKYAKAREKREHRRLACPRFGGKCKSGRGRSSFLRIWYLSSCHRMRSRRCRGVM